MKKAFFALIGLQEILLLIGLGLVFYGVYHIFPPAAFIAVGIIVIGLAVYPALRRANGTPPKSL